MQKLGEHAKNYEQDFTSNVHFKKNPHIGSEIMFFQLNLQ